MTRMNWEGVSLKTDSRCIHLNFLFLCTGFESWVKIFCIILWSSQVMRNREQDRQIYIGDDSGDARVMDRMLNCWHRQNDNYSDVSNKTTKKADTLTNKNTNRIAMMGLAMIKTLWETLWCISARPDREMSRPPLPTNEKLTNKKVRFFKFFF